MDLVLVGLPGSGKSAVGRRIASRHGATFVDLDDQIEHATGRKIPEIFATDGEPFFRRLERDAVVALGPPDSDPGLRRVISPGGGAIVDPRNRWSLYRGRIPVWLDVRPEVLGQRLRRSPNVRPLVQGGDPVGRIRQLAAARERFYAAAHRVNGVAELSGVIETVDHLVAAGMPSATTLLHATTKIGEVTLGEGIAVEAVGGILQRLEARRAVLVSEPGAWAAFGEGVAEGLRAAGWQVDTVMLPEGEAAKQLAVVGDAARELARLRVERRDPLIAIGGGALGDPAGFLAATYLRGVPWIQVPTTLVAQVDSAIGGKTGVDLPEGKNLLGAFHQPVAIVLDLAALAPLPERQRRAALGEVVKMAALGDEALFATLEADGDAVARSEASSLAVGRAGRGRGAAGVGEDRGRDGRRAGARRDGRADHAQPRPHRRARARGGRRVRDAAPRRGGGLRAAGRGPRRRRGRRDAAGPGGADRAAPRRGRPRPVPAPLPDRRGARGDRHRQEARGGSPSLGPADGGRRRRARRRARGGGRGGDRRRGRGAPGGRRGGTGMTRVLVLEGPNLNLVGTREPEIYGRESLDEIHDGIAVHAAELGLEVDFFQSNHEGALIDRLHERNFDVAIVNAGGLTHTSISLRDALLGVQRPFWEVHLSDPSTREPFRHVNYLHDIAQASVVGQGARGYHVALEAIAERFGGAA